MALQSRLSAYKDRTKAVGDVIKCLGEELIPGIRNELYPQVFFWNARILLTGTNSSTILWNKDGPNFRELLFCIWSYTFVQMQRHGISCGENLVKECKEEAGIPRSISSTAIAVGAVSYLDIDEYRSKRDVLFRYDLKVPEAFIPTNEDEEVESFKLNIIRCTDFFKANCNPVVIDFLFHHGLIDQEFLELPA